MTTLRSGSSDDAGMRPEQIALIRQRAAEWVDQGHSQALALLVARRGVVCLHDAWGKLTPAPDSPAAQPDSLFPWSSMTKSVTAVAAMILVDEGLLSLTRPVDYYIPEVCGEGADEILVQHLLTHTSGYDGDDGPVYIAQRMTEGFDAPECPANQHPAIHQMLYAQYSMPTAKPPGTLMSYGNEGYRLLGELIRRITGQSYVEFVAERIFAPLGMSDCHVGLTSAIEPALVCNFDEPFLPDMPVGDALREFAAVPEPSGSVYGPARDCAAFAQMLLNGGSYGDERLLSEAAVKAATRNQIPGVGVDFGGWHDEACWGYGFSVTGTERWRWYDGALTPVGSFGHSGLGGSAYWVDRDNDVVGLYFSHCEDVDPVRGEQHWDVDLFQNMVTAAVI